MPPNLLTNFEIEKYYRNEPKFKYAYSRQTYVKNLDESKSIETRWIALHANCNNVTYFDSFVVESIPK